MTDLEREVDAILKDFHRAVRLSCGISDSDRMSPLNRDPYVDRIIALAQQHARERVGAVHRGWLEAAHASLTASERTQPRTTELL